MSELHSPTLDAANEVIVRMMDRLNADQNGRPYSYTENTTDLISRTDETEALATLRREDRNRYDAVREDLKEHLNILKVEDYIRQAQRVGPITNADVRGRG